MLGIYYWMVVRVNKNSPRPIALKLHSTTQLHIVYEKYKYLSNYLNWQQQHLSSHVPIVVRARRKSAILKHV